MPATPTQHDRARRQKLPPPCRRQPPQTAQQPSQADQVDAGRGEGEAARAGALERRVLASHAVNISTIRACARITVQHPVTVREKERELLAVNCLLSCLVMTPSQAAPSSSMPGSLDVTPWCGRERAAARRIPNVRLSTWESCRPAAVRERARLVGNSGHGEGRDGGHFPLSSVQPPEFTSATGPDLPV